MSGQIIALRAEVQTLNKKLGDHDRKDGGHGSGSSATGEKKREALADPLAEGGAAESGTGLGLFDESKDGDHEEEEEESEIPDHGDDPFKHANAVLGSTTGASI